MYWEDEKIYEADDTELLEFVLNALYDHPELLPDDIPGDFRITGTLQIPCVIRDVYYVQVSEGNKWEEPEYEYDTNNMSINWKEDDMKIINYRIERIERNEVE